MLIGIVGKANVGKSTFFKAATLSDVLIANYPFATIEPNEGIGYVRHECAEKFFGVKCNPRYGYCLDGNRFIPVKLLDVAGLVPGAHLGKGLGNQFLNDLAPADILIHVVDASGSTNEKGEPVEPGTRDPVDDVLFLEHELDMWYYSIMKKVWSKLTRMIEMEHAEPEKKIYEQFSGLKIKVDHVKKALQSVDKPIREWTDDDLLSFASILRRVSKPIIIAANKCDLPTAKDNIESMRKRFPDHVIIPVSAESELALKEASRKGLIDYIPGDPDFKIVKPTELSDKQMKALDFIKKNVLAVYSSTGVQQCLDTAVFDILKYIVVFPGGMHKLEDSEGRILPDAFLMPPGSTVIDFAAKIHQDFVEKFIKAYDVKTKKPVGKDHPLKDGDVIEFVIRK